MEGIDDEEGVGGEGEKAAGEGAVLGRGQLALPFPLTQNSSMNNMRKNQGFFKSYILNNNQISYCRKYLSGITKKVAEF